MIIMKTILIIDDEPVMLDLLSLYLSPLGFRCVKVDSGLKGIKYLEENNVDLILLDIMMPEMDGIEVCEKLREEKNTPIIMLTAKGEESNRVQGFEVGADDYIVKPFSPREVVLRVKAVLRRTGQTNVKQTSMQTNNLIVFPHLTIDLDAYRVTANDQEISLTPKEYELLVFLAQSPDKVYKREDLLKEVWQYEFFGDLRTVDTHVKRLREKLTSVSKEAAKMIVTVWGIGYKLEVEEQ